MRIITESILQKIEQVAQDCEEADLKVHRIELSSTEWGIALFEIGREFKGMTDFNVVTITRQRYFEYCGICVQTTCSS